MKTILVTGANRGIGLEICRQLADAGHDIIRGCRDLRKIPSAENANMHNLQLDVTREESMKQALYEISKRYDRLDTLINNAGINGFRPTDSPVGLQHARTIVERLLPGSRKLIRVMVPVLKKTGLISSIDGAAFASLDEVRYIMETNFYGAWRMIQVFLPLLKKSSDGRIINISSGMGELKSLKGLYPGYSLSKAALNALTIMFSNELKETGIKVNAMCPGWVRTDMGGHNAPREVRQGADTAVWLATESEIPTGKFFRDRKEIEW
ncbi:MAG: SDR family oxidoreductase [Bacteroidetes bacterium]|nr:SDR family oxidoreductase [Bacteroidota bacterium]